MNGISSTSKTLTLQVLGTGLRRGRRSTEDLDTQFYARKETPNEQPEEKSGQNFITVSLSLGCVLLMAILVCFLVWIAHYKQLL